MENYCPVPFGHVCVDTLGHYQICCEHSVPKEHQVSVSESSHTEWLSNQYLENVRDSFRQNKKHPGCASCWKLEADGKFSLRQRVTKEYKICGLEPLEEKIVNIEIQAGNLCNLSCVMCNEHDSSAILAENQKLGINVLEQTNFKWNDLAWNNVEKLLKSGPKILNIRGGEPLYNKKLLELIESMSQEQCNTTLLHITTNATEWNQRWQQALKKFKLVRIMLSIDATDEVYEYIRYPAKWKTVQQNVDQMIKEPNLKLMVYAVIQNLNVQFLENLVDWCQQRNLFLQMRKCYTPDYLQPTNLPDSLIDPTTEKLKNCLAKMQEPQAIAFVKSIIEEFQLRALTGINHDRWNQFQSQLKLRESLRGNDHRDILHY